MKVSVLFLVFAVSTALNAQQTSTPANDLTPPAADFNSNASPAPQATIDPDPSDPATLPPAERFHVLGSANLLGAEPGAIRFGPLYLQNVTVSGGNSRDSFQGSSESNLWLSMAQADLVFDKPFARSRISFQYQPSISAIDEDLRSDFIDQRTAFNTYFALTPRLTLTLNDNFSYYTDQSQFLQAGLSADAASGYVAQNDYLLHPGRWLSNEGQAMLSYKLSPTTDFNFAPTLSYITESGSNVNNRGIEGGGTVSMDKQLSPAQTVGMYYGVQHTDFGNGGNTGETFQDFGLSYSRSLPGKFYVTAQGGAMTVGQSIGGTLWTGNGSVALTRAFRRFQLAGMFTRTDTFETLLTNGVGNQASIGATYHLTSKLDASLAVGTYRSDFATATHEESNFGSASLSFWLTPSISWFSQFEEERQHGSGSTLVVGQRQYIAMGFRWTPQSHSRSPKY